ncbi:MAG: hypothetical protein AAGD13_16625 [Pseudomonadota bacterium]
MTDYTAKLRDPVATLEMFKKYALACTDGNRVGVEYEDMAGTYDNIRHGTVNAENLIRHVKLFKAMDATAHAEGEAAVNNAAMGADFSAQDDEEQLRRLGVAQAAKEEYKATHKSYIRGATTLVSENSSDAAGDRVPCYFLPWDASGAAMELTIPELPDDATADTHPPVFMTAALSGCSIFVRGTARNPRIFHCGSQFDTTGADATEYWTGAMRQILGDDAVVGANAIHNKDYMLPNRGDQGSGKTIRDAAHDRFKSHYKEGYKVEETNPWGAVFGIRIGADWEFYMQENVTVTYRKLLPPTGFFKKLKKPKPVDQARVVARPAMVRKIFPGGGGAVKLVKRWRTLRY